MNNIDKNKIGEVVFNRATISLPTQNTIFEKNSNFVIHIKQPPPLWTYKYFQGRNVLYF